MTPNSFLNKSKKFILAISCFILLFILFQLLNFSSTGTDEKSQKDYFNGRFKTGGINLPKDLNFAGEKVPLNDFNIQESLDRELLINTYSPSQTLLLYKRANRWFPVIEPLLKKYGIPDDFKYIAVIESGLTNSVSPAGATGYWQMVDETAKSYGLIVDEEIDERYNMEKSTEAACKYFREAYEKFRNWTLAAASYNIGVTGLETQLSKQRTTTYYDLFLNEETGRYLFRILAIKDVLSRPSAYGYILGKKDLYPPIPTKKIQIDSSIGNLSEFALARGFNYKILKLLNPWLLSSYLNNTERKTFYIHLPAQGVNIFAWEEFSSEKDTIRTDSIHSHEN